METTRFLAAVSGSLGLAPTAASGAENRQLSQSPLVARGTPSHACDVEAESDGAKNSFHSLSADGDGFPAGRVEPRLVVEGVEMKTGRPRLEVRERRLGESAGQAECRGPGIARRGRGGRLQHRSPREFGDVMKLLRIIPLVASIVCLPALRADEAQDRTVFETIQRIDGFDLSQASEKIRDAVNRVLRAQRGQREYFEAVRRFAVREQAPELLALVVEEGGSGSGAEAARLLLDFNQDAVFGEALAGADEAKAANVMQALVATNDARGVALVAPFIADAGASANLRRAAVAAMGFGREGEQALLELAKAGKLPEALHVAASGVFLKSSDPAIREEAAKVIAMPATAGSAPLPPVAELVRRAGDAANGKAVFQRACFTCHQVGAVGISFGPALSEIGSKLPKEALYTSILDPNAGISFGFEGYEMKLKDGTTLVGFVASETDAEVAVSVPGGITLRHPPGDIVERKKLAVSLMPSGLQAAMTEQELVDLVEYLAALRKAE